MLLDDLAGGKFKFIGSSPLTGNKNNNIPENKGTHNDDKYSIYIQFDKDEPKELYSDLHIDDDFNLTLYGPGPQSEFTFTDNITGKTFKIFAK